MLPFAQEVSALNFDSMGTNLLKIFIFKVNLGSLFQGVSVFGDFIVGDDAEMAEPTIASGAF